jgi:hypothetical protein
VAPFAIEANMSWMSVESSIFVIRGTSKFCNGTINGVGTIFSSFIVVSAGDGHNRRTIYRRARFCREIYQLNEARNKYWNLLKHWPTSVVHLALIQTSAASPSNL